MHKSAEASAEPISVKIPQAVRLSGLSRSRIYELMKSGDIRFAKVGSSTLILLESLRGFIENHRVQKCTGARTVDPM
jgi:excisionase family DNA binding protein